jgi:phosphate transport system substrate-binding protein
MVSWILLDVSSLIDLLRNPILDAILSLVAVLTATIVTIFLNARVTQRKEISYRVISDVPILNAFEALKNRIRIFADENQVESASLLIIEVRNSGKEAVEPIDFGSPIRFSFGNRTVIWSGILDTEPKYLIDPHMTDGFLRQGEPFVELPRVLLNPRDSLRLKVLLAGDKSEVETSGRIPNGKITKFAPNKSLTTRRNVFIALALLLVGALISSILFYSSLSSPTSSNSFKCVSGSIAVSGSSTLYPLMQTVAQKYQANCSGATFIITQTSSTSGLFDVEAGNIQIASTDLPASGGHLDLADYRVAVVVFTVVINQNITGVTDLTAKQLQGIYSGSIRNWQQVGGPDLPITVVSLLPNNGIRTTFEHYVLGGPETLPSSAEHQVVDRTDIAAKMVQTTPGAIGYVDLGRATQAGLRIVSIDQVAPIPGLVEQNTYKFWAIGHMYTKGNPLSNSLTSAFIQYMYGDYAKVVATHLGYINFNEMSNNALSAHQST